MHDDADEYSWPTCTACGRDLRVSETGRQACRPCETRTFTRLAQLPALFAELNRTATLIRGSRSPSAATSGSRVPPIPPRLEVLTLTGPGGVATRLRDIEDAWRVALGWTVAPWRGSPSQAIPEHVRFLLNNLPWAVDSYDSIGQDIDDIRKLHVEITAAVSRDRRPGRVQIGACPVPLDDGQCATPLTATVASSFVQCPNCRTAWDGYAAWRELRLAQQAVLERDTGAAA
jgi:predicted RNA-binding Zn-ribbon protein involved in translation (DUF1610 family)